MTEDRAAKRSGLQSGGDLPLLMLFKGDRKAGSVAFIVPSVVVIRVIADAVCTATPKRLCSLPMKTKRCDIRPLAPTRPSHLTVFLVEKQATHVGSRVPKIATCPTHLR